MTRSSFVELRIELIRSRVRLRCSPSGPTLLTAKPSTIFEIGDIVRVPFPYVERNKAYARPVLVISRGIGIIDPLYWCLMITSALRDRWQGDIDIGPEHLAFGLPKRCVIRTAKVSTVAASMVETVLGRIPQALLAQVQATILPHLNQN